MNKYGILRGSDIVAVVEAVNVEEAYRKHNNLDSVANVVVKRGYPTNVNNYTYNSYYAYTNGNYCKSINHVIRMKS